MVPRLNPAVRTCSEGVPIFSTVMSEPASSNRPPAASVTRLPARRSFVVQFAGTSSTEQGAFTGRIEHVLSGVTASFEGGAELLEALESALASAAGEASTRDASTKPF